MVDILFTILTVALALWFVTFVLSPFYFWKGYFKFFYHDIMHWHRPGGTYKHDGCSWHSEYRFCKKAIMQDSQGNWFTFE